MFDICNVYVTGEMDPSGESVSPGPNLTSEMEPGMNTDISERVSFDKFSSNWFPGRSLGISS